MNDILESVHFEEFFKALKDFKIRSATRKAIWENPSSKMVVALEFWIDAGLAGAAKWREEHPEEVLANIGKAQAAGAKWREEHPEKIADHFEDTRDAMWTGGIKWREEHPEEVLDQLQNFRVAHAKWLKEYPEKARASSRKGLASLAQWREEQHDRRGSSSNQWK